MRVHFIAIGGSAMHNLAIALHGKGYNVTGSDDEIFEPSKSRLAKHGLLPVNYGWNPDIISSDLDVIILGMHARTDNPELLKAQELGLKIYSYPEYLYEQTKDKTRVVIGGSHGKTTTTAIIMHVLKFNKIKFDYMVGAKLDGFETMVGLSNDTDIAIFEGDEYLSSPIDRRPKFHHYKPHVAMLTGIAWDHINVFPTFDGYVDQFKIFADSLEKKGKLIYFGEDALLTKIGKNLRKDITGISYYTPAYLMEGDYTSILYPDDIVPLKIFGEHNLQNIEGARMVCAQIGITNAQFYQAIQSFKGSARRLEMIAENENSRVFYDFAHSPSKLNATTNALKEQYNDRKLVAVMELHTFSSLKKEFLPHYKDTMNAADTALVYFDPLTIEHKKLEPITVNQVEEAFGGHVKVYTNSDKLFDVLFQMNWDNQNLLIMTSGNFSGRDIKTLGKQILK